MTVLLLSLGLLVGAGPQDAADAPPSGDRPPSPPAAVDDGERAPAGEKERAPPPLYEPELEAPEGLSPWVLAPLQAAFGALVALPLTLVFPISPVLVSFLVASAGDLLGQERGVVFWPAVIAYLGMLVGGALPPLGWLAAFFIGGSLGTLGILLAGGMTMGPYVILAAVGVIILYITGISTFVIPVAAAVGSALGQGCGAAAGYLLFAETKHQGDVEFRWPGLFEPSHGPDRYYVGAPAPSPSPVAMAY